MLVMTTKVDLKKILIVLAVIAVVIVALVLLLGGKGSAAETAVPPVSGNDARVKFLTDFGWDVAASPVESSQVRIPDKSSDVFERYNALQKSQGYDLNQYVGKTVMRYVYKVNNFPGATEPVYATVLVYKNQIIGGDITDTSAKGVIQGFKKLNAGTATTPTETTPTENATEPTGTSAD